MGNRNIDKKKYCEFNVKKSCNKNIKYVILLIIRIYLSR